MSFGLTVTPHAVHRFRQRWAPGFYFVHAWRELAFLAQGAVPERRRTHGGQERWRCKWDDSIVFIVKRDGNKRRPVCVTVVPSGAPYEDDAA